MKRVCTRSCIKGKTAFDLLAALASFSLDLEPTNQNQRRSVLCDLLAYVSYSVQFWFALAITPLHPRTQPSRHHSFSRRAKASDEYGDLSRVRRAGWANRL